MRAARASDYLLSHCIETQSRLSCGFSHSLLHKHCSRLTAFREGHKAVAAPATAALPPQRFPLQRLSKLMSDINFVWLPNRTTYFSEVSMFTLWRIYSLYAEHMNVSFLWHLLFGIITGV